VRGADEGESTRLDDLAGATAMKKLASLFAAFAFVLASNAYADAPAAPITLPAKTGAVTFKHESHKALKCTTCHKDEKGGAIEGLAKTMNKDKAHAACHECHKKEAKGPQKCGDCHKRA
jgi:hypothetical protein